MEDDGEKNGSQDARDDDDVPGAPEGDPSNQPRDSFQRAYYVATYVLALVAVLGFLVSVHSSLELGRTLSRVEASLLGMTAPIPNIRNFRWVYDPSQEPSCKNLPKGFHYDIENAGLLGFRIEDEAAEVWYGNARMPDVPETFASVPSVLPAGRSTTSGVMHDEFFARYLAEKRSLYQGPFLELRFAATVTTVGSPEQWRFITHLQIGYNCDMPTLSRRLASRYELRRVDRPQPESRKAD